MALDAEDGKFEGIPGLISENFKILAEACQERGMEVYKSGGGHFLCAGISKFNLSEMDFVRHMLDKSGVGVLPMSLFYCDPEEASRTAQPAVRMAVCKQKETILEAAKRIRNADL